MSFNHVLSTPRTQAIIAWEPKELMRNILSLEEIDLKPALAGVEVLVEMYATGICHTDSLLSSVPAGTFGIRYPKILGHEGAAIVKAVGEDVRSVKSGDRVLLSFDACYICAQCKCGHPAYCHLFEQSNIVGHGQNATLQNSGLPVWTSFFGQSSFSRHSIVSERSIVNVEALLLSDQELKIFAPLGCGLQTGVGIIQHIANAGQNDVVVILGMGAVGMGALMAKQTAKIRCCKAIVAVDRLNSRLQTAVELGASHTINTAERGPECLKSNIIALFGDGASVIVDTTGELSLLEQALDSTSKRGKLVCAATTPPDFKLSIPLASQILMGRSVIGCTEGDCIPQRDIPQMIKWYREKQFPVEKLVSFFNINNFQEAFDQFEEGTTVKPVLVWG